MKRSATTSSEKNKKNKVLQCYKSSYKKIWPSIGPSPVSKNHAFCKACFSHFSIAHGGRNDCRRHAESEKHKQCVAPGVSKKYKPRKCLSLEEKVRVLERLKKGEGSTKIARSVGVNESTVRYIRKNEKRLMGRVAAKSPIIKVYSNKTACHARDPIMKKMEQSLMVWIEDNIQNQIALEPSMIQEMALKIYQRLRETSEYASEQHSFLASKSWYERFKKRFNLQDLKVSEEVISANGAAEKNIPDELTKIIHGLGYSTDQILNPDETVLYWKQVPEIKNESEDAEDQKTLIDPVSNSISDDSDHESISSHEPNTNFNFKSIKEGLKLAYKLECYFIGNDPSMSRSLKFKKDLKKALAPYKQMYKDLHVKNGH